MQLLIEKELRKKIILGHLTKLAWSQFNTFYWLQILHKQADFWGGETYIVQRESHSAQIIHLLTAQVLVQWE